MSFLITKQNKNLFPFINLNREMDLIFEEYYPFLNKSIISNETFLSNFDEHESHYSLTLEMPGVPIEQIQVSLSNNELSIVGERKYQDKNRQSLNKYKRTFSLPKSVDIEKVEANFTDGVLRIYIPKLEKTKENKVLISSGDKSAFFDKFSSSKKTDK